MENIRDWIETAAKFIEALAVLIIVGGTLHGIGRYFFYYRQQVSDAYKRFKDKIGKSLLLGLEFLVAADIIRTVALSPTLYNIAVLGVLVLIRTFLSWSLVVEIEGCWPWQQREETGPGAKEGMSTTLHQGKTSTCGSDRGQNRKE
ncbi:MAG TPA: DUF1622 domain-containing protein [Nitrospiraceae bacterium]|nr:DUF1622 domain-containing protein [Nitrospiraceae bacterium]